MNARITPTKSPAVAKQPPPLAHRALSPASANAMPQWHARLIVLREEMFLLCQDKLQPEYDREVLIDAFMHTKRAEAALCEAIERHRSPMRKGA